MNKKIIILIITFYILGIITTPIFKLIVKKNEENRIIYSIIIDTEYINLRDEIDLSKEPIRKVYKGERYQVIDYYEGNVYNWYKVIYDEDKIGFIASDKEDSWVVIDNKCN